MCKISYEPESLILTSEGVLYVLHRRGVFNVRARNIDRLHETLKPHLDGTHDEAALLASVPAPQQPTIRHYLSKLREAGALREADADESVAATVGKSIFVSLSGARREALRRHDACIFFVTPEQLRRELLTLDYWRHRNGAVIYVLASPVPQVDDDRQAEAMRRREMYARWLLLTSESLVEQRNTVAVYRLEEDAGTLTRLLVTLGSPSALSQMPAQLDVISVADVSQVPLVVARAAHEQFPTAVTKMGLRYEALYEDLAREFGARAVLAECALDGTPHLPLKVFAGGGRKPQPTRALVNAGSITSWQVAGSLLHLRARLLEQYADACTRPTDLSAREVFDLLKSEAEHADVRYLVNVLRLRVPSLPANVTKSAAGLFVYECRGRRASSFIRDKAMRDVLFGVTWDTFYDDDAPLVGTPAPQDDYETFVTDADLCRVVSEREEEASRLYGAARILYRKIRCWGRTAWVGYLEREALGDGQWRARATGND